MNYINIASKKINHFNSKMADSNYLNIHLFIQTIQALNIIHFSPTLNPIRPSPLMTVQVVNKSRNFDGEVSMDSILTLGHLH